MRILVVTSQVTFVPDNYQTMIMGLAEIPEIYGVMVIRNRNWSVLIQGLAAIVTNAAPSLGWQLVKNFFTPSSLIRRNRYRSLGKKFWLIEDLNSPATLDLIRSEKIDLIINARTRTIFKTMILKTPRLGCVNIHHGLLPEQRGLMCDLWAHVEKLPCGFSLHEMTPKIDDGRIIRRVEVPRSTKSYLEYLDRASLLELAMIRDFVRELRETGRWHGAELHLAIPFRYRKNPSLNDLYEFKKSGLTL
jgi:folate-dependent phosphoribosylglycinamide formyltransferase PurN